MNIETLNSIGIKWPGQPGMCLFDMLNCRLQTGSLTWRDLCKTLRSRVVGRYDVAVDIERSIMEGTYNTVHLYNFFGPGRHLY